MQKPVWMKIFNVANLSMIAIMRTRRLNPTLCLAPIDEGPFYAMRIEAGDFGTAGGLATNTDAQVLKEDGSVIAGLFAIGNCSAAILSTYPGPGATLGPAMTMGYQAAKKNHRISRPLNEWHDTRGAVRLT